MTDYMVDRSELDLAVSEIGLSRENYTRFVVKTSQVLCLIKVVLFCLQILLLCIYIACLSLFS